MMEHIYCDAILDLNVLELTVEEPASSFSQLRDVAGLKLLLDLELLPRSFLYPREVGQTFREKTLSRELLLKGEKDVKEEEGRKKHEDHHDDSHQDPRNKGAKEREEEDEEKNRSSLTSPCRIVRLIKETTRQAVRLSEILQLASCLSHPLPPPPAIPREDLENRRDWREKKREEDSSTLSISASILKTEDPPHQTTTASSSLLSSSSSPSVLPPPSSSQAQPSKREGVTVHHPHHERMKSETEATSGHGDLSRSPSHDDHSRTSSSIGVKKSSGQCGEEKRTTGGGIRQEDGEVRLPLLSEDIKSTASSLSTQGGERKTRDVEEGRGYEHKTKQKNSTNIMATPPLHHGDHSRPVTSDHRSDGDPCRDIRLKVKRRLKKENLHWLIDLPALQQKEELQILWNQLYFKYYRTISKLRDMYPLI
ncbi:histone lysine acetyltransferase hat1 [Cystoisospora suis]|uniref:Histone lysine acetyltransferase hat1 n=1 Tax=Cystoisospora suis TaxID=483139 RepID=A0A2C6KHP2_9APIC|nr:histone lysine acetyltransferase hat1 [Cystoisospora suis]